MVSEPPSYIEAIGGTNALKTFAKLLNLMENKTLHQSYQKEMVK